MMLNWSSTAYVSVISLAALGNIAVGFSVNSLLVTSEYRGHLQTALYDAARGCSAESRHTGSVGLLK